MTKLHNISDAAIVDEFGNIKLQIDALKKREEELRDEIVARFTDVALMGERFEARVLISISKRLDTKRVRADLGDALDEYETESTSTRVNVKPVMILGQAAE